MECNIFVIDSNAQSKEEALKESYNLLLENQCVTEGYYNSVIEREKKYPTGIAFQIPVAIPHTDPEYVVKSSICAVRLKTPVVFASMEEPEESLEVGLMFNLALSDGAQQLSMLKALINILQDQQWVMKTANISLEQMRQELIQRIQSC